MGTPTSVSAFPLFEETNRGNKIYQNEALKSIIGNLYSSTNLPVNLFNLEFENPLGVAAGMDKNGEALPAWESIGFGFCEIGGVTLHEQPGNPKPRMFRANSEKALVNRMGFNNLGAREVSQNLKILHPDYLTFF